MRSGIDDGLWQNAFGIPIHPKRVQWSSGLGFMQVSQGAFHTEITQYFLYGFMALCTQRYFFNAWKEKTPPHKLKSTQFSRMLLYVLALSFVFTGMTGIVKAVFRKGCPHTLRNVLHVSASQLQ